LNNNHYKYNNKADKQATTTTKANGNKGMRMVIKNKRNGWNLKRYMIHGIA